MWGVDEGRKSLGVRAYLDRYIGNIIVAYPATLVKCFSESFATSSIHPKIFNLKLSSAYPNVTFRVRSATKRKAYLDKRRELSVPHYKAQGYKICFIV